MWIGKRDLCRILDILHQRLDNFDKKLDYMKGRIDKMAVDLTNLQNAVANETGAVNSAITLIQGMVAEINTLIAASGDTVDPAALQDLANQFDAQSTALANAVAANPLPTPPTAKKP